MLVLRFIYSLLISVSWLALNIIAAFNPKIRLFVLGRKKSFSQLESNISGYDKVVWMHVASLGEFEQGLPVLESIRTNYPDYKIVLTFFSPSGFEVKKNTQAADLVVYLPMDTITNARKFMDIVHPSLAIFVKYEIWPNYLSELNKRKVPTLLVSAIFSKRQIFFKPFGGFMRNALKSFAHFFVQDETSKKLLNSISFENVTVSGDTRFDRVSKILEQNNELSFMNNFKGESMCLVSGSTWPEDEKILIDYINSVKSSVKFVIAPHEIKPTHVDNIIDALDKKTVCYSKMGDSNLEDFEVLVIDTIGLLTKVYSYADIAYVGGGFATGLHNTLEPAVYGIPVIIGPNYKGFKEAEDLVEKEGILSISGSEEFNTLMDKFITAETEREKTGKINSDYVQSNRGATTLILQQIKTIL
ncbi:3-deoxy-D-manno-octulosonic acid transferase [Flagellimonas nanhaiensis]|uniref:3-deoxy-D-manno-octulosonic acid transferase n=1 Tax=Flagellimonas nanhaiensis TaxID=2292706 RepID=UPI0015F28A5B|nr:glycosyltransferase N-terminal domain-containing protein [Allomuricauda nanhaiensis]